MCQTPATMCQTPARMCYNSHYKNTS